jgi:pyruvate carboxylase subunit B
LQELSGTERKGRGIFPRGQNLLGYRSYPDDVVEAFMEKAAEVGIDIFRVFDAVNDERNFISSFKTIPY